MKSFIFEEQKPEIELSEHLIERQPLLIEIESKGEEIRVPIVINKRDSFRGVSTHILGTSYFDKNGVLPPSYFVIFERNGCYTALITLTKEALISGGADEWVLTSPEGGRLLLCLQASNFYETVDLIMRYAMQLIEVEKEVHSIHGCFQSLGWESGLSYGKYVTQEKVLSGVWGMRQQGIHPSFVTVGKGWQKKSGDVDSKKFPLGLQGLVEELHRAGVEKMGVEVCVSEFEETSIGECFEYFNEYFTYLKSEGVSYVKSVGSSKKMQLAMRAASSIHFKASRFINNSIWCRKSGRIENERKYIRDTLIKSLWLQHYTEPDFRSWQTHSVNGSMLAMFTALSGSIVEISDLPGKTNVPLLRKIILPDGKALRADQTITVCEDSIFSNPCKEKKAYKAFTKCSSVGVVGAFNLNCENRVVSGVVSAKDIPGIIGDTFVVYSNGNGILGVVNREDELEVILKPHQSDLFTFIPLVDGLALIGSPSFFLTRATINEVSVEEDSMHFSSIVTGPVVLYSEREIFEIRKNGSSVPWEYDLEHRKLTIDPESEVQSTPSKYSIQFD